MSYTQVATRTTDDANSHADINQLQLNIEALKGGLGTDAPVTTIDALNTWKTDFVEDFGANVMTELNATGDAPIYACRAWVNFDGTTNTGGYCTIRASGNVSSITDVATGKYTINFTTAISDANYSVIASARKNDANDDGNMVVAIGNISLGRIPTTTTCPLTVCSPSEPVLRDSPEICVAVFR